MDSMICEICKNVIYDNQAYLTRFEDSVGSSAHVKCVFDEPFSLSKIQSEQKQWALDNFGEQTATDSFLGVVEEVGELAHAELKMKQGIRNRSDFDAKDAVGDIAIFLMGYCNAKNFDLAEIIDQTWREVKKRKWKKDRGIKDED